MRLLVMVASVLLAACGGSGAAFAERANGICEDANEQVVALEPEPRIVSAEHADWLEEELTRIDRAALERLRRGTT